MKIIVYSVPSIIGAVCQACIQLVPEIVYLCKRKCLDFNYSESHHPRITENSAHWNNNLSQKEPEVTSSPEDIASSDQEIDQETGSDVSFFQSRAQQAIPNMFMPYIEGPKMDLTVNDAVCHRFLKWHLNCENILQCELAALSE